MDKEFDVKEKVIKIVSLLDELEDFENNISSNQSIIDMQISDLYHLLEMEKLDTAQCWRFVKKLKAILNERRILKERTELIRTFNTHRGKLSNMPNRQILLSEIGKAEKQLRCDYKFRVLTEEDIEEIMKNEEKVEK